MKLFYLGVHLEDCPWCLHKRRNNLTMVCYVLYLPVGVIYTSQMDVFYMLYLSYDETF